MSRTKLGPLAELSKYPSKGFQIGDVQLFSVAFQAEIKLYKNQCPHLGLALEFQKDRFLDHAGEYIQCSTHGALFEMDSGSCVSGPCLGQSLTPIDFEVENGIVYVSI